MLKVNRPEDFLPAPGLDDLTEETIAMPSGTDLVRLSNAQRAYMPSAHEVERKRTGGKTIPACPQGTRWYGLGGSKVGEDS